jgi:hypothetical protein
MRGIDIIATTTTTTTTTIATDRHRRVTPLGPWAALALVCVLALGMASTARAAAPLSWSPPQPIVNPGVSDLSHAACAPSSSLCVASDLFDGDIAASSDATGGAGDWITGNIDGRAVNTLGDSEADINGIACASTSLCVAVDDSGHILSATDPAEGSAAWKKILPAASEGHSLGAVSCPSTSLCVVADSNGTILTATSPAGGVEAWKATKVAATPAAVSCTSETLCVAVSVTGQIMTSTDPTGGESAWTSPTASVDSGHTAIAISCPVGLCAFTDSNGEVVTSTAPTGGAGSWSAAAVDPGEYLNTISCPSAGLCALATEFTVMFSTSPTGGAGEWHSYTLPHDGEDPGGSVACASTSLCVAGLFRSVITTTTPTSEGASWTLTALTAQDGLDHVSCASATLCIASEPETANVLSSSDPSLAPDASWSEATLYTEASPLTAITCAVGGTLCVAVNGNANIYTTTNAGGGASQWTKTSLGGDGASDMTSVSCPSVSFCAIVDYFGQIITSTNPTAGAGAWHISEDLSGDPRLESLSCPTASFCAATEAAGAKVFTSTDPAGGASEWRPTELASSGYLDSISCASASLCVAGYEDQSLFTSTDPTGGASKWKESTIEGITGSITGAACPGESLCVLSEQFGTIITATSPAEGASAFTPLPVDFYERGLNSLSCPTTSFCAAVDESGDVIIGSALGPVEIDPPTITGEALVGKTLSEAHGSWTGSPTGYSYEWQRCTDEGTSCSKILGAESQTLTLSAEDEGFQIRVRERAENAEGTSPPAASALTAPVLFATAEPEGSNSTTPAVAILAQAPIPPPPPTLVTPPPSLGQRQALSLIEGTASVRIAGTSRFVPVGGAGTIPNGSEVEATNGRVLITVATLTPGQTQSAEVYGGRFVIHQEQTPPGETHMTLSLPLTGCPRVPLPHGSAAAVASSTKGPRSRHLWVSEHGGSWGTNGRYVSTTVEGTHWLTLDECNRSEVQVLTGKVKVHNLIDNKTKTLTAGESYLASRR